MHEARDWVTFHAWLIVGVDKRLAFLGPNKTMTGFKVRTSFKPSKHENHAFSLRDRDRERDREGQRQREGGSTGGEEGVLTTPPPTPQPW